MRVTITIETDNDAFGNGYGRQARREVLRMLTDAFRVVFDSDATLDGLDGKKLRDVNGNTCGSIEVTE